MFCQKLFQTAKIVIPFLLFPMFVGWGWGDISCIYSQHSEHRGIYTSNLAVFVFGATEMGMSGQQN